MPSWCHCHSLSLAPVKSRFGFTFLVPAHLGSPGKGPLNGCVCVPVAVNPFSGTVDWTTGRTCKQALFHLCYSCVDRSVCGKYRWFQLSANCFLRFWSSQSQAICGDETHYYFTTISGASRYLPLKSGGFWWAEFYCSHVLDDGSKIGEWEDARFLKDVVYTICIPCSQRLKKLLCDSLFCDIYDMVLLVYCRLWS